MSKNSTYIATSEHPIVFLYDTMSEVTVPEYQNNMPVGYNKSCVSIITRHYLDGRTTILFSKRVDSPACHLVFDGCIEAPSKTLSLNTSEKEDVRKISLKKCYARVKIWMDDTHHPKRIDIEVR